MGPKVKAKKFPDGEVTGLEPGKKYEFRVRAENKAGLGEPSESTNPHLMKVSICMLNYRPDKKVDTRLRELFDWCC